MIVGVGVDICDIGRIYDVLERQGQRFTSRVCSPRERGLAGSFKDARARAVFYAERFAAKEACAKTLGTGIAGQARWHDIEIVPDSEMRPRAFLSGTALRRACRLAQGREIVLHVNIARHDEWVTAFAILRALVV